MAYPPTTNTTISSATSATLTRARIVWNEKRRACATSHHTLLQRLTVPGVDMTPAPVGFGGQHRASAGIGGYEVTTASPPLFVSFSHVRDRWRHPPEPAYRRASIKNWPHAVLACRRSANARSRRSSS